MPVTDPGFRRVAIHAATAVVDLTLPSEMPVAAPCASEEMPQTTSCWFAEALPEPEIGSEPVALPPQTNCAETGALQKVVIGNEADRCRESPDTSHSAPAAGDHRKSICAHRHSPFPAAAHHRGATLAAQFDSGAKGTRNKTGCVSPKQHKRQPV